MYLKDILKEYKYNLLIKNYSPRTIKGYNNNLSRFFNYCKTEFGIEEVEELTQIHIKKYLTYLQSEGRSPTYTNTILKNIRAFYNYCYEEEYGINIAKKISFAKEKKVIINTFTDEEVKKMINVYKFDTYLHARNKAIIAVLFDTGIRCAELCNLKTLDVKETVIYIKNGKGNKERVVPISPYLKKILIKYERIKNNYLKVSNLNYDNYFLSFRYKPLTNEAVERMIKICGEKAKVRNEIRCSPHDCRHYFAQAQLRNGLDVYSLSRLLGHEDIIITKRYLQSLQDKNIIEMSIKTSPLMNLKK